MQQIVITFSVQTIYYITKRHLTPKPQRANLKQSDGAMRNYNDFTSETDGSCPSLITSSIYTSFHDIEYICWINNDVNYLFLVQQ